MAIQKKWSHYSKANVKKIPNELVGYYEIANTNTKEILYMGEGILRTRLLAHLPDGKRNEETVVGGNGFRYIILTKEAAFNMQNLQLKKYLKKYGKKPSFNQRIG